MALKKKWRWQPLFLSSLLLCGSGLEGGPARRLKDIFPGRDVSVGLNPSDSAAVGSIVYFVGTTESTGAEVWRSDGTEAGTRLARDIFPGAASSVNPPAAFPGAGPMAAGGAAFFAASDGVHGTELWKSDGTADGTGMVADLALGTASSNPVPRLSRGGDLFFTAGEQDYAQTLWKTDGTAAGTARLSMATGVKEVAEVDGLVYFNAGNQLWKTDGTPGGTVLVRKLVEALGIVSVYGLTNVNGTLFFVAGDSTYYGYSLWKSDGTEAGTVKTVPVGGALLGGTYVGPSSVAAFAGALFYLQGVPQYSYGGSTTLWKSDGTSAGTGRVKDLADYPGFERSRLLPIGNTLYVTTANRTLWKSDGTEAGTVVVTQDLRSEVVNVDGTLFFGRDDGANGSELWKSDGTTGGTVLAKDIEAGAAGSSPSGLVGAAGALFFGAFESGHGRELWKSDGTEAGTSRITDHAAANSSHPDGVNLNGALLFGATAPETGGELWRSDGTEAGTLLVADVEPGDGSSSPGYLTPSAARLFFSAAASSTGAELWTTDGTSAGTRLVRDIVPGAGGSGPGSSGGPWFGAYCRHEIEDVAGTLFFVATEPATGGELWRSDGTEAGTFVVKDIVAGSGGSYPCRLSRMGGSLFFFVTSGPSVGLWKTDGTEAGTTLVKALNPILRMAASNGRLFFSGAAQSSPFQLWSSDGTTEGTVPILDQGEFTVPLELVDVGGTLFFDTALGGGRELWKSDGTAAGTVVVKDIQPGSGSSSPDHLTNVGGRLFFAADDGVGGRELWTSDGTEQGTRRVKDINPGAGASNPASLIAFGGRLFFSAYEAGSGRELWMSDGTETGTVMVDDIGPAAQGHVGMIAPGPTGVFFSADDGLTGTELWFLPATALPPGASIDDRTVGEGSAMNAAFRVSLSSASTSTVTVQYQTANATAVSGSDYTAASGTLTFTPGRTQHSIFVPIATDATPEGSETFFVNLSSPQNAILADAQAVGTIQDPPAAAKIAMYRSYNKSTDYHFFTTDLSSKNFAVNVLGFQDESTPVPFYVWNSQQTGTVPLFRMYNPNLGRHFYTASSGSRDFIMAIGGVYEKEEGFVFPMSTSPVPPGATELFLLYNNNSGTHLFTADAGQKDTILSMFQGVWVQHTSVGYVFTSP